MNTIEKIIHVVLGKANPNRMNGVNKVVHQLATAQHAAGQQVEIWGITQDLSAPVLERSLKTRLFAAQRLPFAFDSALIAALKAETAPVMVHFHGGFITAFAGLAKALRRNGIPYCITGHGAYNSIAMETSKWKKRLY
ncbi:MAG: glycosyltransferase family 4 protein, partial [Bacteroidota bacterium]